MSFRPWSRIPTVVYERAGRKKTVAGVLWIHPNYTVKNCLKDVLKATMIFIPLSSLELMVQEDETNLYNHFTIDSPADIWFRVGGVNGDVYSIRKADMVEDAATILAKYPE
jgi:hypothetical protein